jgi:hypothetical protein
MRVYSFIFALMMAVCGAAQSLPTQMKDGAGQLRIGIANGNESRWISKKSDSDVTLTIRQLKSTDGFIVKVERRKSGNAPMQLFWAFGGCSDKPGSYTADAFAAEDCRDNVFSVEGNAFVTYYGESMKLRVTSGVTPIGSVVRLCDGNAQASPLALYNSGKRTDAPVICGACDWLTDDPLYICIYKQNAAADYNYYMLPGVFDGAK